MKKKRRAVWFGVGAGVGSALGIVALVLVMGGAGGGAAGGGGKDLLEGFPTRAEAPLPGVIGVQVADAEGRVVPSSSSSPAQAAEERVPPTILAPQSCDFPQFIGKPVDEAALKALGRPYRVLPPGAMATMDFSPVRINLETDDKGLVTRITCG